MKTSELSPLSFYFFPVKEKNKRERKDGERKSDERKKFSSLFVNSHHHRLHPLVWERESLFLLILTYYFPPFILSFFLSSFLSLSLSLSLSSLSSSHFHPIFSSKFDHRFLFILETKCYDLDHFVPLSFPVLHHFVPLSILLLLFSLHLSFFSILSKVNPSLI